MRQSLVSSCSLVSSKPSGRGPLDNPSTKGFQLWTFLRCGLLGARERHVEPCCGIARRPCGLRPLAQAKGGSSKENLCPEMGSSAGLVQSASCSPLTSSGQTGGWARRTPSHVAFNSPPVPQGRASSAASRTAFRRPRGLLVPMWAKLLMGQVAPPGHLV